MKRYLISLLVALCVIFSSAAGSDAATDYDTARCVATLLGEHFKPEEVSATVDSSRAYVVMKGVELSGIRIESMRLDALLTGSIDDVASDDVESLGSLIGFSKGEITLLERDVNAYFETNETSGFSALTFDFSDGGFEARGVFSAELMITIKMRLRATGHLALGGDGVYLDGVKIYTEEVMTPEMLTNMILESVNPLVEWSSIPFKVDFKEISIDDEKAVMTGFPEEITGTEFVWKR